VHWGSEMATDWKEVLKTVVFYIVLPVGAIFFIYKIISDFLMGPFNTYKELWMKQYDEFIKELKQFAEEDEGALTEEHQTILFDGKLPLLRQTEKSMFEYGQGVFKTLDKYVSWFVEWVLGALSVYVGWKIFKEWKETRIKTGDVQSEQGAAYIAMCMIADDLADRGFTSYASALARTIATRFENIDKPYMESQIVYWQSQLPNLVGWQLLYANYIITAYQITINMVPIWISYLPPPILEAAGIEIKARA